MTTMNTTTEKTLRNNTNTAKETTMKTANTTINSSSTLQSATQAIRMAGVKTAVVTIAASVLWATAASGAVNVLRNGVTWDATYEGTLEPPSETPSWVEAIGGAGSSRVASGGILTITTPAAANVLRYDQTGTSWTGLGSQRTIEWRMRVVSQTAGDRATDFLSFDAGSGDFWILEFQDDSYRLVGSAAGSDIAFDTTQFHTYRWVIDTDASVDQSVLYIDGSEALSSGAATAGAAGLNNFLAFGDGSSGGVGGVIEVDFISWTAGAFAPVPEPSVLSLLVIGGLALANARSRQRRRLQHAG